MTASGLVTEVVAKFDYKRHKINVEKVKLKAKITLETINLSIRPVPKPLKQYITLAVESSKFFPVVEKIC